MSSFTAQVIGAFGRGIRVRDESGAILAARPFGRRLDIACGDRVRCEHDTVHDEVHAVAVLSRTSALFRSNARGQPEIVAANLSLVAVVIAPRPAPDWFVVDRYLAAATSNGIGALLVCNKSELGIDAELQAETAGYFAAGYAQVVCSARAGLGLDALAAALRGHTAIFVGQSGVGKSSLVRALLPESVVATGELDREDEGRHTTAASQLYDLAAGGHLIDSPGVRDFVPAIETLEPRSLGFPEIDRLGTACRFQDCRHLQEPGCAVRAACDRGELRARRYESYRRLRRLRDSLSAARGRKPGPRRGR
ncbi:MAG: ribosome small subunit-dependent GTPase A [Steroidobacteraceae bacterium]